MTDETDRSVFLTELQVALLRECNNQYCIVPTTIILVLISSIKNISVFGYKVIKHFVS